MPVPSDEPDEPRAAAASADDGEARRVNVIGSDEAETAADDEVGTHSNGAEAKDAGEARSGRAATPDDDGGEGRDDADGQSDEEDDEPPSKTRRRVRSIIEWTVVIAGALLVALVVRTTLAQAFWIPSPSMEPTLHEGDRVLVNKLSYRLHDVHRGDIIVFERPPQAQSANPDDDIHDLIKRVIGLPGDTIEARADGSVYVNGRRLNEPYIPSGVRTTRLPPQEVPEGHVFVMGDNRNDSSDSRDFGPIDEDLIVGRAFLRIYPLGDIGGL